MIVTGIVLCCSIMACLGSRWWLFALADHFRFHYLVLLSSAMLPAGCWRLWKTFTLLLVLMIAQLWGLEPWGWSKLSAEKPKTRSYSLVWFNVHTGNDSKSEVLNYLIDRDPDFICLGEVNRLWLQHLGALSEKWPHQVLQPRDDNFGMAVYSKFPFKYRQKLDLDVPCIQFEIENDVNKSFSVFVGHPVPPVGARFTGSRDRYLRLISDTMSVTQKPFAVVGDFNATPWHYPVEQMIKRHQLSYVSPSFMQPLLTWPIGFLPVGIPIDLFLTQPGILVHALKRGPDLGSDHRPIETFFSVP